MGLPNRVPPAAVAPGPLRWWRVAARIVPLSLAAVSATVWAFGVTVLQPLSEPEGPGAVAENNTYWARELRWGALIALVVVLLVPARGARWTTRAVLAGGCAWLAVDVGLDRIDPASGVTELTIGAVVAALLCGAAVSAVPGVPRPGVLLSAATVAAVASGLATGTASPTDSEPALRLGSAAVGSLLAVVAVAAAHAAGTVSRLRAVTAVPVGALAAVTPWLLRHAFPEPTVGQVLGTFAFTVLLVVAVVALAGVHPRSREHRHELLAVAAITTVVLPAVSLPFALAATVLQIGQPFTALAANPPINAADEDVVIMLLALPIGLVLDRVLRGFAGDQPSEAASAPGDRR